MLYRQLGRTGIDVSCISFGAGPVSGWEKSKNVHEQIAVVKHAVDVGMNWFDTAATYGEGQSETALGRALVEIGAFDQVHVATKVRLNEESISDIRGFVLRSFTESLKRLQCERVTLLQLHNSITAVRGDQPTSITPDDVLGPNGVLAAFEELRSSGVVRFLGLTGLGDAKSMKDVIHSARFDTVQTPYNLLNPSAGQTVSAEFHDSDYGNILSDCERQRMGAFAIRVFAGGALADREPSAHTKITRFFPMDLYERDRQRGREVALTLPLGISLPDASVKFSLAHPAVTSALIGFATTNEIDQVVRYAAG
ncbi:MAG: aldo/keto reductase [Planctomycetota bacterium]|nr:aldo/keto reductase [Planctomycetota bacterium]MDA1211582.1 aldo/keto reductase [Planctomycetota bacterium]